MLGIYAIVHRATGRRYVGQSVRIEVRFGEHRKALHRNKHYNLVLQRAWNKYGGAAFDFVVLEQCEADNLTKREQFYIDQAAHYNLSPCADAPMRGKTHTEETRQKMIEAWKHRDDRAPTKGRPLSEETKAKLSAALKGRALSEETKTKMSKARKGVRKSPESAEKVRAAKLGVSNAKVKQPVQCVETGQVFDSLKSAAQHFQGSDTTLSKHLAGKLPRFRGYTFQKQLRD